MSSNYGYLTTLFPFASRLSAFGSELSVGLGSASSPPLCSCSSPSSIVDILCEIC